MTLFIAGLIIGTLVGLVISALLATAKKGDEIRDGLYMDYSV